MEESAESRQPDYHEITRGISSLGKFPLKAAANQVAEENANTELAAIQDGFVEFFGFED